MPVRAVLPRELGCESDDSHVLLGFLKTALQVADSDTYGQNPQALVTFTGASSFQV